MVELFDKYASWKILYYFALNSSKEVYVKEIAKKLNLSPGICRCWQCKWPLPLKQVQGQKPFKKYCTPAYCEMF